MTLTDDYIHRVIDNMPRATPLRSQIALELHGLIAERLERGQSIDEVVKQLGDPVKLAESYLSAVPLVSAPFWSRAAAKLIDALTAIVTVVPLALFVVRFVLSSGAAPPILTYAPAFAFVLWGCILAMLLLPVYTAVAEYRLGYTWGKWLLGLRVVRDSGARISLGQSLVRQLPVIGQIYLIDALFALFTELSQRAFELASGTRVVRAEAS